MPHIIQRAVRIFAIVLGSAACVKVAFVTNEAAGSSRFAASHVMPTYRVPPIEELPDDVQSQMDAVHRERIAAYNKDRPADAGPSLRTIYLDFHWGRVVVTDRILDDDNMHIKVARWSSPDRKELGQDDGKQARAYAVHRKLAAESLHDLLEGVNSVADQQDISFGETGNLREAVLYTNTETGACVVARFNAPDENLYGDLRTWGPDPEDVLIDVMRDIISERTFWGRFRTLAHVVSDADKLDDIVLQGMIARFDWYMAVAGALESTESYLWQRAFKSAEKQAEKESYRFVQELYEIYDERSVESRKGEESPNGGR